MFNQLKVKLVINSICKYIQLELIKMQDIEYQIWIEIPFREKQ